MVETQPVDNGALQHLEIKNKSPIPQSGRTQPQERYKQLILLFMRFPSSVPII